MPPGLKKLLNRCCRAGVWGKGVGKPLPPLGSWGYIRAGEVRQGCKLLPAPLYLHCPLPDSRVLVTAQSLELCSLPLPGQLLGPSYPPEGSWASTRHITALSPGKRAMRSGSEGRDGFTKEGSRDGGGGARFWEWKPRKD